MRIVAAIVLGLLFVGSVGAVEIAHRDLAGQAPALWPALTAIGLLALIGLGTLGLIRRRRFRPWMGALIAGADVALALGFIAGVGLLYGLPGNYLFAMPAAWVSMLVLAFNALRYRPRHVAFVLCAYVLGIVLLSAAFGFRLDPPPPPASLVYAASLPANMARLGLLMLIGFTLALAALRARRLLVRAIVETREKLTLTRFLPAAIAPRLAAEGSALRQGAIADCVILFVDMRGSTGIAERMTPVEVAGFLTRFRRRITRATEAHGGLIEKFTGDGALVVFGVPDPAPDDAARALACARDMIEAIEDWNERRGEGDALAVGIGIHAGPVFCGVVGDEARLEFTVVGDPVNAAARLEALAKRQGEAILASRDVLERAGVGEGDPRWVSLGPTRLRGRREAVEVVAYRGEGGAPSGGGSPATELAAS